MKSFLCPNSPDSFHDTTPILFRVMLWEALQMWISPLPPLEVVICTKAYLSQTSVCLIVSVIFR